MRLAPEVALSRPIPRRTARALCRGGPLGDVEPGKRRWRVWLWAFGAVVLLGGAGGLTARLVGAPSAAHRAPWPGGGVEVVSQQSVAGMLAGVSVVSASDAWAVGAACHLCMAPGGVSPTLVMHWNGTAWSRVRSPSPGISASLTAVSAGRKSGWAVGWYCTSNCDTAPTPGGRTLILHWDGRAWSRVPSPAPGGNSYLVAVSPGPDGTAWAAGAYCANCGTRSAVERMLILHWDGKVWSQVASPSPGSGSQLNSISSGPGDSAWAVGGYCPSRCGNAEGAAERPLIVRWDGTAWSQVTAPRPGASDVLDSVRPGPSDSAWAVGWKCAPSCLTSSGENRTLTLRWDGTTWSQVASPTPGGGGFLSSAATGPGDSAYAIGYYCACRATSQNRPLILRWDGTTWSQVASPSPGGSAYLTAVSSSTAGRSGGVWAVGWYCTSGCGTKLETDQTLALHWDSTGVLLKKGRLVSSTG
jgi:hypothetical protein